MQASVIIPAYNAEPTLRRAVASAIAQGNSVGEILIVDNNSSDDTRNLAQRLINTSPVPTKLLHQPVQGAAAARNLGTGAAIHPWVQYLDADDELLPGKLARQLQLPQPDTGWIMGAYILRQKDGQTVESSIAPDPWKALVYNGGLGNVVSNLFRRSALLATGGWPTDFVTGEDLELYFQLLRHRVGYQFDQTPGAIYHQDAPNQLSKSRSREEKLEAVDRTHRILQYLAALKPDYLQREATFFRSALLRAIRQVYTYDSRAGKSLLNHHFPMGIAIEPLDPALLPAYAALYKVLPFNTVERLRAAVGSVLHQR